MGKTMDKVTPENAATWFFDYDDEEGEEEEPVEAHLRQESPQLLESEDASPFIEEAVVQTPPKPRGRPKASVSEGNADLEATALDIPATIQDPPKVVTTGKPKKNTSEESPAPPTLENVGVPGSYTEEIDNSLAFSSAESVDIERLLQLQKRKTLTLSEADELGMLQAKVIERDRQMFALALKESFDTVASPKFNYDLVYSVVSREMPKLNPNADFLDCKRGIAEAQNHLGYLTSIYLQHCGEVQDYKSVIATLKSAWQAISMKNAEKQREGEFALHFWKASSELARMQNALDRLKMAMDLAASTRDAISRQLTAIDMQARITGEEVFELPPDEDSEVEAMDWDVEEEEEDTDADYSF